MAMVFVAVVLASASLCQRSSRCSRASHRASRQTSSFDRLSRAPCSPPWRTSPVRVRCATSNARRRRSIPFFGVEQQTPVPRWSGTIVVRWAERWLLGRLRVTADAVLDDDGTLARTFLERDFPGDARQAIDALRKQVTRSAGVIAAAGKRIDPVLDRAVKGRMQRISQLTDDIENVIRRHLKRRDDIAYGQFVRLRQSLRPPDGKPQERVLTARPRCSGDTAMPGAMPSSKPYRDGPRACRRTNREARRIDPGSYRDPAQPDLRAGASARARALPRAGIARPTHFEYRLPHSQFPAEPARRRRPLRVVHSTLRQAALRRRRGRGAPPRRCVARRHDRDAHHSGAAGRTRHTMADDAAGIEGRLGTRETGAHRIARPHSLPGHRPDGAVRMVPRRAELAPEVPPLVRGAGGLECGHHHSDHRLRPQRQGRASRDHRGLGSGRRLDAAGGRAVAGRLCGRGPHRADDVEPRTGTPRRGHRVHSEHDFARRQPDFGPRRPPDRHDAHHQWCRLGDDERAGALPAAGVTLRHGGVGGGIAGDGARAG